MVDPIHKAAQAQGMDVTEVIHFTDEMSISFIQNQDKWTFVLTIAEGVPIKKAWASKPHGPYPDYRTARVAAWKLVVGKMPKRNQETYTQRVGYAWDKLIEDPPERIEVF